jgi:hypothetical protein
MRIRFHLVSPDFCVCWTTQLLANRKAEFGRQRSTQTQKRAIAAGFPRILPNNQRCLPNQPFLANNDNPM